MAQTSYYQKNDYLFRESEGKFAIFLMRYFCELHDLKNFEKNFFLHIPSNTLAGVPSVGRGNSLECLQLGEEGMQGPARALAEELASEDSSLEKIFQREGNERVCCTGHIKITILSSSIVK